MMAQRDNGNGSSEIRSQMGQRTEDLVDENDAAPFPRTRISFATAEDSARAWDLVSQGTPTVGLPNRGMVVDLRQLLMLKAADIPIYRLDACGEQRYDNPLDIDQHIEAIRNHQRTAVHSGGATVRPEA